MIVASHGIIGSSIVQFVPDSDAQAFFDRVTTAGGTLSNAEKTAVNQLVLDMKDDGIWTKMKAVYPMVGASAAACAQNLKSSSFTGTFTAGWTFASTGVNGNGTSAYMNTNLNDNSILSLDFAHISIYSRTNSDGLFCDIGLAETSKDINIFSKFGNFFYPRIHNENNGIANSISSLGFFISNRISSTEIRAFQNNSLKQIANASGSKSTFNIFLAAANGSTIRFYSSRQYAFASIGDGLTDTEASDFYDAVQAMQVTLSRNV
jgi:hypothetical protein